MKKYNDELTKADFNDLRAFAAWLRRELSDCCYLFIHPVKHLKLVLAEFRGLFKEKSR